jgi:hypothetical protein
MDRVVEAPEADASLQAQMDGLSLEQALLDFEVANARVLDLTRRLVDSTATISQLSTDLQQLQIDHASLKAQHDQMRSSHAFKIAERIWALRNAARI